jgi:hypothetical protein
MSVQSISDCHADLQRIYAALDSRVDAFEIGLLRHDLADALRALSRANPNRIERPSRDGFITPAELLSDLRALRTQVEQMLLSGTVNERDIVQSVGPALHEIARAITHLVTLIARATTAG